MTIPTKTVIATRPGGYELVLDDAEERLAHVERDGRSWPLKPLDAILARGYWEPVESLEEFNVDQPRWPKGVSEGGRWRGGNPISRFLNFDPTPPRSVKMTPAERSGLRKVKGVKYGDLGAGDLFAFESLDAWTSDPVYRVESVGSMSGFARNVATNEQTSISVNAQPSHILRVGERPLPRPEQIPLVHDPRPPHEMTLDEFAAHPDTVWHGTKWGAMGGGEKLIHVGTWKTAHGALTGQTGGTGVGQRHAPNLLATGERPAMIPVRVVGPMDPVVRHDFIGDNHPPGPGAEGMLRGMLKRGQIPRKGYWYINEAEGVEVVNDRIVYTKSAVVPNRSWLRTHEDFVREALDRGDPVSEAVLAEYPHLGRRTSPRLEKISRRDYLVSPDGLVHVYHGTRAKNLDNIRREGLKEPVGVLGKWPMVTSDPEQARRYVSGPGGAAVIHFALSRDDAVKYLKSGDPHDVYERQGFAHGLMETLPSRLIVEVDTTEPLQYRLRGNYPGLDLWVSERDDALIVSKILVPKDQRGQGLGTKVMREILAEADERGLAIYLTPEPIGDEGGSKAGLKRWYRALGFVRNRDSQYNELLVREPKIREFSVNQPRWPKGMPFGGRWKGVGEFVKRSLSDETLPVSPDRVEFLGEEAVGEMRRIMGDLMPDFDLRWSGKVVFDPNGDDGYLAMKVPECDIHMTRFLVDTAIDTGDELMMENALHELLHSGVHISDMTGPPDAPWNYAWPERTFEEGVVQGFVMEWGDYFAERSRVKWTDADGWRDWREARYAEDPPTTYMEMVAFLNELQVPLGFDTRREMYQWMIRQPLDVRAEKIAARIADRYESKDIDLPTFQKAMLSHVGRGPQMYAAAAMNGLSHRRIEVVSEYYGARMAATPFPIFHSLSEDRIDSMYPLVEDAGADILTDLGLMF